MTTSALSITGHDIEWGEERKLNLDIMQNPIGLSVPLPFVVRLGPKPGPIVLLTGAVHGDELNGCGIVQELIDRPGFTLECGGLILVPVVNVVAFHHRSRYLPDRRDLNRAFPGLRDGSLASRWAAQFFQEVVKKSDYLIDMHTAGSTRTNLPNIRVDASHQPSLEFARMAGSAILVHSKGSVGTLRREAVRAGVPSIVLEAGETHKFEPAVIAYGLEMIRAALGGLGMINTEPSVAEPYMIHKSSWIRTPMGGILHLKASVGDIVKSSQVVAEVVDLLGDPAAQIRAPQRGLIIGVTTAPVLHEGEAIIHLARFPRGEINPWSRPNFDPHGLLSSVRTELAGRTASWPFPEQT